MNGIRKENEKSESRKNGGRGGDCDVKDWIWIGLWGDRTRIENERKAVWFRLYICCGRRKTGHGG